MIIDWENLSYSEALKTLREIVDSAPGFAEEWRHFESSYGIFYSRGDAFDSDTLCFAEVSHRYNDSRYVEPNNWSWEASGKSGFAQTLEEAQRLADRALTEGGVRLPR